ncbi:MAG: hypothetical protein WC570_04965, partial [Patescibacteria group bacterium]
TKIYYVYGRLISRWSVHTAYSDLDGTNFIPTQQTFDDGVHNYYEYKLFKYGGKIFYTFMRAEPIGSYYTASTNADGTGWTMTQRVATGANYDGPAILADSSKIYYVWNISDGANYQIWTAESDHDGANFTNTKRTTSAYDKYKIEFVQDETKLYFVWQEHDGSNWQIWTAEMNKDGSGWTPTKQTTTLFDSQFPNLMSGESKIYYVYTQNDGVNRQLWSASADYDGSNFSSEKVTSTAVSKKTPTMYIDVVDVYYLWDEAGPTGYEMKTANGNYQMIIDEGTTVTASVPSLLTFSIDGVAAGNACANSGGNASVTTTATTIPFGVYSGAQTKIACQTLTVSTNATDGYVVTVQQNQDLTSAGSDIIAKFSGTYAVPIIWTNPPGSGTNSYFGFTTDDTDYSAFQSNKYSKFAANITPYAIALGTQPVVDEANVISYQLEVNNLQEAGIYTNTVMYIATAVY